ncbi:MAG TPA: VOC family protein [Intrasporangium sp.]|uniref:VOC family protein n=1 Tax=Intrasporangium sp. TaxID=1925024 RepID=UPI002D76D97B|nr:VOC family protein [Intrasporangium sp.]HET7399222.1 VOC family protein [Intrasporangium sp.]
MRGRAREPWWGTVLEAPDAHALADFYSRLLDWPVAKEEPGWVVLAPPDGFVYLAFQHADGFVPPVWPPVPGEQRMTMHLDVEVEDLETSVADAVALGARVASHQPQANVRVLLDPAGHPFCLYVDTSTGDSS